MAALSVSIRVHPWLKVQDSRANEGELGLEPGLGFIGASFGRPVTLEDMLLDRVNGLK